MKSVKTVLKLLLWPSFILHQFMQFLSNLCAHGVQSLGRPVSMSLSICERFLKPCEELVETVNVVDVVKT